MGLFDKFKRSNDNPENWIEKRENHYSQMFGPIEENILHSSDVKDVHIDIYQFAPNADRPFWILATGGMSDLRQPIPEDHEGPAPRAEIFMYADEPSNWMFNVLKGLAEMPFDYDVYLHWFHTVPNGQPMTAEPSNLTSFFFLPPYFERHELSDLKIDGDGVDFLWMIPITEKEREYAMEKGSQALEEVFEKAGLETILDLSRDSLV